MIALTSTGVEEVTPIDKTQLDHLGQWLCQEKAYHGHNLTHEYYKSLPASHDREHDAQCTVNGGYCDVCKNFAGEIISLYSVLTPKE